jgi:membrane fusion protein (multidrug efflux system)
MMRFIRKREPWAAAATILLVAILGCSKGGGAGAGGGGGGFAMPPMPVEVAAVQQAPVADRFESVGSIEAGEAIDVVSEIDGVVTKIPFREGEFVREGALIAQLDDALLRAEVARAEALRDQTRTSFDRIKEVVDQAAGAAQDLDDAAAALKVAEANLAFEQARLQKTRILAPWAGIISVRRVSPGAFVRAGQPLTQLAAISMIKVTFTAPERYLASLRRGAPVTVSTTAYPGYELTGDIDVIEPVLDVNLRSARILARVRNPEGKFRPGMSANVSATLAERGAALVVPNEAVFVEGNQSFVFVVATDSTVARQALVLGTRQADVVEVVNGLSAGAQVVRAGHQKLFDGAKVMPIPAGPPPGGAPPAGTTAAAAGGQS